MWRRWLLGNAVAARVAHIPCRTGVVRKTKQNVTLVREYLAALVEEPVRRRLARARLRKAFETGLVDVGDRKRRRNDLYDR